ncbi:MAG TPA: nuclear transport factor 2 family protein [Candidatus Thermoplasmatota archaeon]|nr:nuclear transport factor 2 family protein [Candidatus Thermoplasmatota archaeon]
MDPDAFATSWLAAFNAQDLEAIMGHYAEDVEHSSPTVARLLGEPSGVVRGKEALRAYFAKALASAGPGLRYERTRLYVGAHGVTLLYDRSGGKLVAETFQLDARGLVVRAFVAHAERVQPRTDRSPSSQEHAERSTLRETHTAAREGR